MLLTARLAFPSVLGFALLLAGGGCDSDSNLRDQYWGTDAGAGYQLPDGGRRDSLILRDAPVLDSKNDTTPEDVAADAPQNAAEAGTDAAADPPDANLDGGPD
jgi:hypothetical protein